MRNGEAAGNHPKISVCVLHTLRGFSRYTDINKLNGKVKKKSFLKGIIVSITLKNQPVPSSAPAFLCQQEGTAAKWEFDAPV